MPDHENFSINDVVPTRLGPLTDGELLAVHAAFVKAWGQQEDGAFPGGLNRKQFLGKFAFVVSEFGRRTDLEKPKAEGLDDALSDLDESVVRARLSEFEKRSPHHLDLEACLKLHAAFPDEVLLHEDFIRFGGNFLNYESSGGLRGYIQEGFGDSSRELKIRRMLRAATNQTPEFTLCPDGFPEDATLSGYDLILRKRKAFDLQVVSEPEFQSAIYSTPPTRISESVLDRKRMVLDGLMDFVHVPAFVSITGSFVYHDPKRKPQDVDVVVKSPDERDRVVESLSPIIKEATGFDSHWVWEMRGPNWSSFPVYDLVCRVRRDSLREQERVSKALALKAPDPKFILDRLGARKEAILLTGQSRSGIAGKPFFLVNERLKKREGIFVWALVTFDQEADTIRTVDQLGSRKAGLDELTRREFEVRQSTKEGPFFVLKLKLMQKFAKPIELKAPPGGRGFGGEIDLARDRLAEAFHIRGTHWIPIPSGGQCPVRFPTKGPFPGKPGKTVCFTKAAARIAGMRMSEQDEAEKLENQVLNLREKDFPEGRCGQCRYFVESATCKILQGPVGAQLVCDGFQGLKEGFPPYKVRDDDWLAFVGGMVKEQPYQHVVVSGHLTPEGPIVIIKDTIEPKAHIFSLSKDFHIGHTCVDMETRAVTKDGPKSFDMLQKGEEVFCLNPETGCLELKAVKEIKVHSYSGQMFHWVGRKYNFLVTPNHRIFCSLDNKTKSQKVQQVEAVQRLVFSGRRYAAISKETGVSVPTISRWVNSGIPSRFTKALNRKSGIFDVLEARNLVGRYKFQLPVPTGYKSWPIKPISIPRGSRRGPLPSHISPEVFLPLAGWYVSEGCSSEKYGVFSISAFSASAIEEIRFLFDRLGQKPNYLKGQFVLYRIAMAELFGSLFGRTAKDKKVPEFVKNAPPNELKLFLEAYLKGDGTIADTGAWRATTVSARLKDDLVEIAWKLGFIPSVGYQPARKEFVIRKEYDCLAAYTVSACQTPNSVVNISGRPKRCQELDYTGIVWCPVIPDYENFLMEREGKYVFTGNSTEHHWTQQEVDRLIKSGMGKINARECLLTDEEISEQLQEMIKAGLIPKPPRWIAPIAP